MSATTIARDPVAVGPVPHERPGWAAVTAGAVVATAVTVMLLFLGSGIGLGSVSTQGDNPSPVTFTALAAIWLIIVQWIAAFFGGYVTGRLRPAIVGLGTRFRDAETLFRDTALGFVSWAITTLIIVAVIGAGATSLLGGTGKAIAGVAASAAGGAGAGAASSGGPSSGTSAYLVDMLFRPSIPNAQSDTASAHAEAAGILATAATGPIAPADHDYLVQMVAARTGLAPDQATQRVDDVIGKEQAAVQKAKQVADAARRFAAETAIYTFFSMLIGAFISCVAAAIGGRQRDTAWRI